MVEVQNEKFKK